MRIKAVAVLILFGWYLLSADTASAGPLLGQPAPSLVATELSGQTFNLSQLKGKVVLVNYWATWCAPCKKEMPVLNQFYRDHHKDGLELIGISTDRSEDYAKMRTLSRSLAYPTALFDQVSDNGFGAPEGFPLTYVIDGNGTIRDRFVAVDGQLLSEVVLPLLRELQDARPRR